jgi:hypothetical protein
VPSSTPLELKTISLTLAKTEIASIILEIAIRQVLFFDAKNML